MLWLDIVSLKEAVIQGNLESIEEHLDDEDLDFGSSALSMFVAVVTSGQAAVIKRLLEDYHIHPRRYGQATLRLALVCALEHGNLETVDLLLTHPGVRKSFDDDEVSEPKVSILGCATKRGKKLIERLLQEEWIGHDPTKKQFALNQAARHDIPEAAEWLLMDPRVSPLFNGGVACMLAQRSFRRTGKDQCVWPLFAYDLRIQVAGLVTTNCIEDENVLPIALRLLGERYLIPSGIWRFILKLILKKRPFSVTWLRCAGVICNCE